MAICEKGWIDKTAMDQSCDASGTLEFAAGRRTRLPVDDVDATKVPQFAET